MVLKLKKIAKIFAEILIVFACVLAFVILLDTLLVWSLPDEYLFYEEKGNVGFLFGFLGAVGASAFGGFHGKWKELWTERKKLCILFLSIAVFTGYYLLTGVTYVTPDTITSRSLLNPTGSTYKLEEIKKIETGFGDNDGGLFTPEYDKLGNFYYKVYVDDKELVFHAPIPNNEIDRYMDDSYLELEEFDQKLESLGISKEGNPDGAELCDYDDYYVERFLRIIE